MSGDDREQDALHKWQTLINSNQAEVNFAINWFKFIGIEMQSTIADSGRITDDGHVLYSFLGAVDLAERLPDEFEKWRVLYRMGVI